MKQKYSLAKQSKSGNASARTEGMFFKTLWEAEPNQVIGPVKGFYRTGTRRDLKWWIKWRVVKILGKTPGREREYSSGMEREAKERMRREEREEILRKYRKEVLWKYPYKIYAERIKDIDPLDIP